VLAPGLSVCSKWAPTGARQTYSNAFRCFQGSQTRKCVVSVFLGAAWWSCLVSCKHAGSRFSFLVCAYLQQQRHPHHSQDVRLLPFAHYCTAAWKPFASCFIAVPRDWLAVCVCVCVCVCARACVPSALRLYLTSLPALPASEVLACCVLPATCYLLLLLLLSYSTAALLLYPSPIHTITTPPSQPYPGLSRRLPASHPSIHPDSRSLSTQHPPVPPLLALPLFRPASLPWRAPDLSSSFAWHTAASHSMRCSW
jgi:hypothetical protein